MICLKYQHLGLLWTDIIWTSIWPNLLCSFYCYGSQSLVRVFSKPWLRENLWRHILLALAPSSSAPCSVAPRRAHTDADRCHRSAGHISLLISSLYAIARPSVVCLSSVTFVRPTEPAKIFGNWSSAFGALAICWNSREILRDCPRGTCTCIWAVALRYDGWNCTCTSRIYAFQFTCKRRD